VISGAGFETLSCQLMSVTLGVRHLPFMTARARVSPQQEKSRPSAEQLEKPKSLLSSADRNASMELLSSQAVASVRNPGRMLMPGTGKPRQTSCHRSRPVVNGRVVIRRSTVRVRQRAWLNRAVHADRASQDLVIGESLVSTAPRELPSSPRRLSRGPGQDSTAPPPFSMTRPAR
jgi:hypothetical protein